MVAPAYIEDSYVDHTLSANLDSTFAFEGPEKLLEIWFWKSPEQLPSKFSSEGLRSIPLDQWVQILDLVNCKILSMKSSSYADAYLLSESSLFVFQHKLILKTCGTTTTLACLDKLFQVINKYYFKDQVEFKSNDCYKTFYSRRSFMFPDKQKHVHRSWKNEVFLLNKYFKNGKSYVVGDCNSDDHWYLYTGSDGSRCCSKDQTFEVLMTELDPECASKFFTSRKPGVESLINNGEEEDDLGHKIGIETMKETKLDSIFNSNLDNTTYLPSPISDLSKQDCSEFIHDAFSFSPCGFSSNSISSCNGGYYYTLHITPESGWSYASFETNFPFSGNSEISVVDTLIKILAIFKPGKFSTTLVNDDSNDYSQNIVKLRNCSSILSKLGYQKQERVLYDLDNSYELLYLNFVKLDG